jgi:subtilisin-like proprotein convertase family protein
MGAIALALEANPALTWRDVLHLLVQTARKCDPADASWTLNGAGHDVSYKFGYGAVDAGALCAAAVAWPGVGPEVMATSGVQAVGEVIPDNTVAGLERTYVMGEDLSIEAVELVFEADHSFVGDLAIELESPAGTVSQVAVVRASDGGNDYNAGYLFTSMRHFGESSAGEWAVRVRDGATDDEGVWESFEIRVYGTANALPCSAADCDGSGSLNVDDVQCFVTAFLSLEAAADCDGSGVVNVDDVDCFVAAFLAGCP